MATDASTLGFCVAADGTWVVDGSVLEGGGQILRNCTAMAALMGKRLRITNIRGKRSKPGLKRQHLTGLQLVAALHKGTLDGGKLNSRELTFSAPVAQAIAGSYASDIGTAGSVMLLAQISLPCAVFGSDRIVIDARGGTNCIMAPQVDYTQRVFKPIVERFGVEFELTVKKRGFFPKGGGQVILDVSPVTGPLKPITMDKQGDVTSIKVWVVHAHKLPRRVAEAMANVMKVVLQEGFAQAGRPWPEDVEVEVELSRAPDTAGACLCIATTSTGCVLAGSHILDRKQTPRIAGEKAATMLLHTLASGGCTGEYLTDQLIIFMALAKGRSRILSSVVLLHTKTAIHFAQLFTGAKFSVEPAVDGGEAAWITCDGIGFVPGSVPAPGDRSAAQAAPASVGVSSGAGAGAGAGGR